MTRALRALQGVALLLPPALFAWPGWQRRWVAEDAFIDLRVVQHLLSGHGPVFNPGERVEAYTNPLWVALLATLALPFLFFADAAPPAGADAPWRIGGLEWIAVWAGLITAAGGVLAAEAGALGLLRRRGVRGLAVPLGAVVFVALPATWDYATSGLETGLALGWLGATFWALATGGARGRRRYACAALAGSGPLIRPDLAVFAAAFLLVLLAGAGRRPRAWIGVLLAGGALPVAYQVFRMGYFGTLLPNTALAKEAGMAYWEQGWLYLADFVTPYALWLPLGALSLWGAVWVWAGLRRGGAGGGADGESLLLLPPLAGVLHALYVARVGGDFMHGRMLLPSLFGLLLPLMVVAGVRPWQSLLPALVVLPWALVAAVWLRPPYFDAGPNPTASVGTQGIADERGFYVRMAGHAHPVTLADYEASPWAQDGHRLRRRAGRERGVLTWGATVEAGGVGAPGGNPAAPLLPLAPAVGADVVAVRNNIGLSGYAAGSRVHLVDRLGLGDPLAARLRLARRGRPGHEKELPDAWAVARFGAPAPESGASGGIGTAEGGGTDRAVVDAARAALACGDLPALLSAVRAPLTPGRFADNVSRAPRLTALRFPADPRAARAQLCP